MLRAGTTTPWPKPPGEDCSRYLTEFTGNNGSAPKEAFTMKPGQADNLKIPATYCTICVKGPHPGSHLPLDTNQQRKKIALSTGLITSVCHSGTLFCSVGPDGLRFFTVDQQYHKDPVNGLAEVGLPGGQPNSASTPDKDGICKTESPNEAARRETREELFCLKGDPLAFGGSPVPRKGHSLVVVFDKLYVNLVYFTQVYVVTPSQISEEVAATKERFRRQQMKVYFKRVSTEIQVLRRQANSLPTARERKDAHTKIDGDLEKAGFGQLEVLNPQSIHETDLRVKVAADGTRTMMLPNGRYLDPHVATIFCLLMAHRDWLKAIPVLEPGK